MGLWWLTNFVWAVGAAILDTMGCWALLLLPMVICLLLI